ncbi:MAG: protein-glutamate O-methyltransferase CheR [Pseudomonadota bacterium]
MSAQAMLRRVTGLNLSKALVDRAIRQRMELTGSVNREVYLARLTPDELTALTELVVVPESWLFRDPQAFFCAVEFVQARLAVSARTVRILSIPCAGGEEPYSMAMALCDAGVARQGYTIDAFDLSPVCVARARAGVYGRNAFRAQDLAFRERYFTPIGDDDYRIDEAIRNQVRFSQGNLLAMDSASKLHYYDVIFCRNLLIYFDKPTTAAAIGRLSELLSDDGILFAGYAEVPSFAQNGFSALPLRQAFALKKEGARPVLPSPYATLTPPAPVTPVRRRAVPPAPIAPSAPPPARPVIAAVPARGAQRPAAPAAPVAPAALLEQARKLADRGEHRDATAACQGVLATAPESAEAAEAYFILGMLSEHAQQPAQANDYWRRCIYLQPDHYEALCHLALLAEQNGDGSGAAALKARAARIYQRRQGQRGPLRAEP